MKTNTHYLLSRLTAFKISGPEKLDFLQGLVTNDLRQLEVGSAQYALMLTPNGRFLFELMIYHPDPETYILDVEKEHEKILRKKLKLFKLKSDVQITDFDSEVNIMASLEPISDLSFKDPRHDDLGYRTIIEADKVSETGDETDYDLHRIQLGIPDGTKDMVMEKSIAPEFNMDEIGALNYDKGCYLGQELIARTKHQGLVRKKIFVIRTDAGQASEFGEPVFYQGEKIGKMHSKASDGTHDYGLAMIRLEFIEKFQLKSPIEL